MTINSGNTVSKQINTSANSVNTADKYEQLFQLYEDFQKEKSRPQKNGMNFWGYINEKGNPGFVLDWIAEAYDKLADKGNLEEVKNILNTEQDKENQKQITKLQEEKTKNNKIQAEQLDRTTGLWKLWDVFEEFQKDPNYKGKQGQINFIHFMDERKAKMNDTSETYFGFTANEIEIQGDKIEKPSLASIKEEEITNSATEQKINTSEEKAETPEEKTLVISKSRLRQTIEKYIGKLKVLKDTKEWEKKTLEDEIKQLKEDLAKQKTEYNNAKQLFLGTTNYKTEELSRVSTKRIRWGKKTVQWWVVTRTLTERLQFATLRRRMTANILIKKFNDIGDKPTDGVRLIMGFQQSRFLRYTGINISAGLDNLWSKIWLKMDPEEFHKKFNIGKNNILTVLDYKWEKNSEEEKVIDALKNRINYYGQAYARQRATAWTDPFLQAEKSAEKDNKIIQMYPDQPKKLAA